MLKFLNVVKGELQRMEQWLQPLVPRKGASSGGRVAGGQCPMTMNIPDNTVYPDCDIILTIIHGLKGAINGVRKRVVVRAPSPKHAA